MAESPRVVPRRSLDVHPERGAATDGDPPRGELDVADVDLEARALRGGSLVACEVLPTDREDVRPRGKGLAADRAVAVDDERMIETSFPTFRKLMTSLGAEFA